MWAEPTFISALCEAGPSVGLPLCPFGAKQRRRIWNRSCADSAPVRRAILRGWRSCAESSLPQTVLLCGEQSCADSALYRCLIFTDYKQYRQHSSTNSMPVQQVTSIRPGIPFHGRSASNNRRTKHVHLPLLHQDHQPLFRPVCSSVCRIPCRREATE